jgi:anti-sigma factor RsiW
MTCEDIERLVEAYADGELALESTLVLEAHLTACEACTARLDRVRAVKQVLRAVPYFRAPEALVARMRATVAGAEAEAAETALPRHAHAVSPRYRRWQPWLLSAASLAVASLALVAVLHERAVVADDATTEAVIEGHVRSLMAGHLMDVASTDRHTVKPWFAGRVDFSPTVVDLMSDGFPLVGGRLDYIDHHAAAALVYKRREHAINVFVWPQASGSASHVTRSDARGFHVISWTRGGVAVWIVSDLAVGELDDFAQRLDAATQG